MARQYYYLVAGLHDLVPDEEKQTVFIEPFLAFLEQELHPADMERIRLFLLETDNANLISVYDKKEGDITGPAVYTRDELETALRAPYDLPEYMQTFLEARKNDEALIPNLSWEDQLSSLYYAYALDHADGFCRQWLTFDRDLRNVLAALNCRKYNLPLQNSLVADPSGEDFLCEQLLRSSSSDFGLSREYPWVEQLVLIHDRDVLIELEKETDLIRWNMIDELTAFNYFDADVVFGWFRKLLITERWFRLIPEKGEGMFDNLVGRLKDSFVIDETQL